MKRWFLIAAAACSAWYVCACLPASAMTTQQERDWGRGVAHSIMAQQGRLDDPLLQRWVDRVGASLVGHSVRGTLPYTFTVIDSEEVNAFSLPGGYIFVDAGLLNFVHSDDELAAVLGHEIGHVERRHVVTLTEKARALEILLDVAGLFAPGISRFGNIAGNLTLYKLARVDELQADQYGLMLMSQAGYDPEAMVSFLSRLEQDAPHPNRPLQRFFETHPAVRDRVAHLKGYAPLDQPASDALLVQAIRDARNGEYYIAREKLARLANPTPPLAREYQDKLAAIFAGTPAQALSVSGSPPAASEPQAAPLRLAAHEREAYERLIDSLDYSVDSQSLDSLGNGSHTFRILSGQVRAGRYFDHAFDQVAQTLVEAPDCEAAAQRLLAAPDLSAKARAVTRSARTACLDSVQAARGAMGVGTQSALVMRRFLDAFDEVSNYKGGDMHPDDYHRLHTPLRAALLAARSAAASADVASGMLNNAKAALIVAHLDTFDPLRQPASATSFGELLQQRFGADPARVRQAAQAGLGAGQLAVAAIVAAESGRPLVAVARQLKSAQSATEFATAAGVRPETLQLELGLIWTAYSDGSI
ncbi:MAG: M48 family metalloprotease [Candidatus Eremiobacteraeota bacterium]|nr:M48 family metalloprotease [Candidatus Eremiobacteraeota bacterium]